MANRPKGVRQRDEALLRNVRRDPRRFSQQIADVWRTPEGAAITIFLVAALLFLMPAAVYLVPLFLLFLLPLHFSERRHRHLPMRLPIEAGIVDYNDPKPQHAGFAKARGMVLIGNSTDDNGEELWSSRSDELTHSLTIGATGAGKSVMLVGNSANYLAFGGGLIYSDAKASPSLYWDIATIAFRMGREDDLQTINYMTGNRTISGISASRSSNTTNPFVGGSADSWIQTLSSLIKEPDGQNAVFGERALAMVSALLYGLHALNSEGHCDIGVGTIRDHLPIEAFEQLAYDPRIEGRPAAVLAMRSYLKSLPGYKPPAERIKKDRGGIVITGPDGKPVLEGHAEQVYNQHGFAQMYFTRAMSSLTDTYGHIYAGNLPEVDYVDTVRRRRILVIMLPALEKSLAEISNLGKINLAALRDAVSTGLGSGLEGHKAGVLDNLPTDSPIATRIILDEAGYQMVEGFAILAAQARGLGFSVEWAGQDWAGIKRGSEKEAEQIWSNTTMKRFGRLEDAETFQKLQTQTGEALIAQARGYAYDADGISSYRDTGDVGLEKRQRVDFNDLQQQVEGEFHIAWRGRLIRGVAFAALLPSIKTLQINRYLRVGERNLKLLDDTPPSDAASDRGGKSGGGMAATPTRPAASAMPARSTPPTDEGSGDAPTEPRAPMRPRPGRTSQAAAAAALTPRIDTPPAARPDTASATARTGERIDDLEALLAMDANADFPGDSAPGDRQASDTPGPASDHGLDDLLGLPSWSTAPTTPADVLDSDSGAPAELQIEDMPDVIDLRTLLGEGSAGEALVHDHVQAALDSYPDRETLAAANELDPNEIVADLEAAMKHLLDGDPPHDDESIGGPFG